ncbi:tetratricopeptide repeat protein [Actinomadura sp. 9N215]|uniref:tetratricopeptide repeat protein n=1 Tax=Actinomadura sp. 9N215 TaxID=3375150 RepID=UPI0037919F58
MTGAGRMQRWWRGRRAGTAPDGPRFPAVPEATLAALARPGGPPARWSPGLVVDGVYEIGKRCGAGRSGVVDQVRHLGWGLDLAVKSPQPRDIADPESLQRFLGEAVAWLGLPPHPHLCACHFVRVLDGTPRVFAEYADGGSVADALSSGGCATVEEVLDVAVQLAWALRATHDAGLAHRDVRLAKALRTSGGVVKLLPGGAPARRADAEGRAGDVRSWAAAVLEMFSGRATWPTLSQAGDALAAYVAQPPPERPAMPEPVAALLRDCLTSPPDDPRPLADRLIDAYQAELGRPYPREPAEPAELDADGLNNKALSFVDLGRREDAERCWEDALRSDPRHPDTTYNRGLLHWRAGDIDDRTLIDRLEAVAGAHPEAEAHCDHLLGRVHLERGDTAAAAAALEDAARAAPDDPGIAAAAREAAGRRTGRDHVLTGHTEKVWSVAITDDGRHVLSGGFDKTVRWWDLSDGRCVHVLSGHDRAVTSVSLTPTGCHALTCSVDGVACVWVPAEGRLESTFEGGFISAAITPDMGHLLTGGPDGMVRLRDSRTGRWLYAMSGHEGAVSKVALTPDVRYGVSCDPPEVQVWDLTTGQCVATLTGDLHSVALPPDGRRLLTGHNEGSVKLWSLAPESIGSMLWHLSGHIGKVHSVAITADSRYAVSGGRDGTLRWWDLTGGRCLRTLTGHTDAIVSVAVTPDGRHAVSCGHALDKTVRVWELGDRVDAPWSHCRPRAASDLAARTAEFRARLERARRSLDGDDVAGAAAELRRARAVPGLARHPELLELWRRSGGRGGRRTAFEDAGERGVLTGHTRPVATVAITPDGRRALSGSGDRSVRYWDLETGECLRRLTGHTDSVPSVAITGDGRYGLSGGNDGSMRWWDLETGKCVRTFTGHTDSVHAVAMTPDRRHAVSGSNDGSLRWWDLDTGDCLRIMTGHTSGVWSAAVTPDGRYALSGSFDRTMRWWDLSDGRCLGTFTEHTDAVQSVAFTPDGRRAFSAGDDTVRLWELSTGECVRTMTDHTDTVMSVAVTADARHAFSSGEDATVRLWDVDTGRCLRVLRGHSMRVWSVATTPGGTRVLSGSSDTELRLWDVDWDFEFPDA